MANKNAIGYLLNPKNWRRPLLIIFTVSIAYVTLIGIHTYTEAPPIPNYVSQNGVYRQGQKRFEKYHPETITQQSKDEKITASLAQY